MRSIQPMTSDATVLTLLFLLAGLLVTLSAGCRRGADEKPLAVGYSSLTPLHTALGLVMERTPVLAQHGLTAHFKRFERGKDQDRAAQRGEVDVTFTCEVPAMVHLDRLPGLMLTGSPGELGDIALVVPASSAVRSPGELRGAVALQGGASSRLLAREWLAEPLRLGLVALRELRGHPRDAAAPLARGEVQAAVLWDPWLALARRKQSLRVLARAPFFSVAAVFEGRRAPGSLRAYHLALRDALAYVVANPGRVAGWVAEVSPFPAAVVGDVLGRNRYVARRAGPSLAMPGEVLERLRRCEREAHSLSAVSAEFRLAPRLRPELVPR